MTYETAGALRMALEQRLLNQTRESGISLDRLRRRVIFERVIARLQAAEPGCWVLKGGMALEVRLRDGARLTKDIDLGLRGDVLDEHELHERLVDALTSDPFDDWFAFTTGSVTRLTQDGVGHLTWRARVGAHLAGKPFGGVQLDVSPRAHELDRTDIVLLPNSLAFAGIHAPAIEIVDVHRHAAEKLHGMLKDFGERENTRVRDLVDLVILCEHHLLHASALAPAVEQVWREREEVQPPVGLPPLPESWPDRYDKIASVHDLSVPSFPAAILLVMSLWADMFPTEES